MKRLQLRVVILLALCLWGRTTLYGQTTESTIDAVMTALETGLKEKDFERVSGTMSENVSISTNMGMGAHNLLRTILEHVDFESVRLLPDTLPKSDGMECFKASFVTKQHGEQESVVAFDYAGKIAFIDYFDRLFGQSRYRQSLLVTEIPFRMIDNSIVLTLRLNDSDRNLSFLLDTGADGMAIRRSLADSLGIVSDYSRQASVVGGSAQVSISSGNSVYLTDSLTLVQQNIAVFDEVRHSMDGIIGLNLVKNYITEINFDRQKLFLYNFGDLHYADTEMRLPFRMHGSLILVPSVLNLTGDGAQRAWFLFDTGANYKLIVFSDFVEAHQLLKSGFVPESFGTTVSLGHSTPVCHGTASELVVGEIVTPNVPVTLQMGDQNNPSFRNAIDGSLGVQFWAGYHITIDMLKKEIHLAPR